MNKVEILKRLKSLGREISELRNKLNLFNEEKERLYKEKEEIRKKADEAIEKIKDVSKERSKLNEEISRVKKERDSYNEEIRELIKKARTRIDFKDPSRIKKEIDKLDFSIETNAYSFDKERKVNERIKQLKKEYEANLEKKKLYEEKLRLNKEIMEKKKKADELHNKLKEYLNRKKAYSNVVSGKEIDWLRKNQKEKYKRFLEFKRKFLGLNEELKNRLRDMGNLQRIINEIKRISFIKRKKKEDIKIKKKTEEIEEKLKKKEKITTDDLIAYQGK